ncbi:SAV_2336 N-terminal domain-related protein [Streptomyces sp. NPDC005820]|uniref:SAV_2336 N-terminal domain-related protein n=1 Tax=Streptomyces sp. NPDC005820 TaxID=3157069 RepID=UPI0033D80792
MTDDLLARLLRPADDRPTWQELADALWLAGHLPRPAPGRHGAEPAGREPVQDTRPWPEPRPPETVPRATGADPPGSGTPPTVVEDTADVPPLPAGLYLPGGTESVPDGLRVRMPTTPALPSALALRRALRPLGRRTPPGLRTALQLDEEATVDRVADTGFWLPVLRPAPTRWLDVALVVDDSVSMAVWDRAVHEFRDLLHTAGAFRSVQDWTLPSEESGSGGVVVRRGLPSASSEIDRSPGELVDPNGRRVVLVVSDCISAPWSDGTLDQLLRLWGRTGPVAIVQPLPRRMWERCRLNLHEVKLRSPGAGAANARLATTSRLGPDAPVTGMPVPLLMLDPRSLGPWASLTSGESPDFDALVTMVGGAAATALAEAPPTRELSATERVQEFKASASDDAYKLLVHLSAVPLSPPVMRIVQRAILKTPHPSPLAEIQLSGLLVRTEDNVGARGDAIVFDFLPGVREALLGGLGRTPARHILKLVSQYVSDHYHAPVHFPALLRGDDTAVANLREQRPFAVVSAQVLRRLSPNYETIAQNLEHVPTAATPADPTVDAGMLRGTLPPRAPELLDREPLLTELHRALTSGDGTPQVLSAPEGGGATAVAVEYAHTHGSDFDRVLWLSAGSPTVGGADLARLADELTRLSERGTEPSWLLVLDGATPGEELPTLPVGRRAALVTSADPDWPEGRTVHRVPALRRRKAIPLARLHAPALSATEATDLVARLAGSPLALELAATFLTVTHESAEAFLDRLGPGDGPSPAGTPPPDPPDPAVQVCGISLDHVLREHPSARGVLHCLGVLAPGPVDLALLTDRDSWTVGPALAGLRGLALLREGEPGSDTVFVHPVVQRACRERMSGDEPAVARRAVRARMVASFGSDVPDAPVLWPRFAALTRQLDPVGALGDKDPDLRELVLRQLRYLRACGDTAGCRALGTLALRRLAATAGVAHHGVRVLVELLADVLEECGAGEEAAALGTDPEDWLRQGTGGT